MNKSSEKIHDWSRYESIFKHYQLTEAFDLDQKKNSFIDLFPYDRIALEKNESKSKTIDAKTMNKKSKQKKSQSQGKKKRNDSVINIPVPPAAQSRKTNYTAPKTKQIPMKKSTETPKSTGSQALPNFQSNTEQSTSISDISSVPVSPSNSSRRKPYSPSQPSTPIQQTSITGGSMPPPSAQTQSPDAFDPPWNLTQISEFIRDMFYTSPANTVARKTSPIRSDRVKLRCDKEQAENVDDYIATRGRCIDIFEEYVEGLRRQHGIIREPALDPPTFEPGITIMGSKLQKDPEQIDREDASAIKKMQGLEPRKKYALVHEDTGIFIIGGYLLDVNIPAQKEPTTDYVMRFNGQTTRIPTIKPARIHFGIYTDGDAIYIAGGQTIHNNLLDDVQRLNLKTLKWEYVATLANPIAACGMTIFNNKIHIVGGYDILKKQTIVLPDYTVYNLSTNKFERSSDLPSPRCRSLIFVTNDSIYCVSGLSETRDPHLARKMTICRDILRLNEKQSKWDKVSETPPLSTSHALAFTEPYLEVVLRTFQEQADGSGEPQTQAYYHFPTNTWHPGKPPAKEQQSSPFLSPDPSPKAAASPKTPQIKVLPKSKPEQSPTINKKALKKQSASKGKSNRAPDKKKKKK